MKRKMRLVSLILTVCILIGVVPAPVYAAGLGQDLPFSDVKSDDWFYDAVQFVYNSNLMTGTSDDTFSPNITVTRGMIVTVLHRMEGSPLAGSCDFEDVDSSSYYAEAVSWASDENIVNGFTDSKFGPDEPITREQTATILYRYANYKDCDLTTNGDLSFFSDSGQVSSYAIDAMRWAVGVGLLSGVSNSMLEPDGNATRAQAATILMRFCELNNAARIETCTVTFDYNYENKGAYTTIVVEAGTTIDKPTAPTRTGYSFSGWYTKAVNGEKFDFDKAIVEDITLYAYWDVIGSGDTALDPAPNPDNMAHTVTFDINCDGLMASPEPQSVLHGEHAVVPSISAREGYQFAGWFLDKNEPDWTNVFSFGETPIVEDITLYAIWVDITTDTDGDGLSDELEQYIGTNIYLADTDGDGLTDYQEVVIVGTDPLLFDTDNDGISDYDADMDSDSLNNGTEVSVGTDPNNSDSDSDGLTDYEELHTYKTSPTNPDTDSDGAPDGWEIENGFDPLIYNSSFSVSIEAQTPTEINPVTAGVNAQLDGSAAGSLAVTPIGASSNPLLSASIPGYLGSAYNFEIDGDLYGAELRFSYDESVGDIGPGFQPRIYYFNEATGTLEELENQTVADGMVSAPVSHFSTYILLNKVEFDQVWNNEIKAPIVDSTGHSSAIDVVFAIDVSGSMSSYSRLNTAKTALSAFLDALSEEDRAALVKFSSSATTLSNLTQDKDAVAGYISSLSANGKTSMYRGLEMAINLLTDSEETYGYKMIIVLSDGSDEPSTTYESRYESLVENAKSNNIVVYTVGAGTSVDTSILSQVARNTGGAYYAATETSGIIDAFIEIQSETVDLTTDSNDDGIPDYFNDLICTGALVLSNGSNEFRGINFNFDADGNPSDDWDGDGLKNGEELIVTYNENTGRVYMTMASDPMMVHSDGDGISDYDEVKNGTDPLKVQYDDYYLDLLTDNNHYYYEGYVSMYDDSILYQVDSAFLAVVFGLWNIEELFRDILADYFLDYVDALDVEAEREERAIFIDIADDFLGTLSDINGIISDVRYYKGLVNGIKNLISVANGYSTSIEAISVEYVKMVQEVSTYYPEAGLIVTSTHSMSSTSVSVLTKTSPLKTGSISGVSIAFNVLGGAIDMADTITTLAAVNVNSKIFDENMDYLVELRDNGSRRYMKNAAAKIINTLGEEFGTVMAEALAQDAGELTANILISIASANPYVKAVKFLRDVIAHVTGIKETLKIEYQMLAYNCMSSSAILLINKDTYYSNGYYYSYSGNLLRYLTHLAQIRILGEKKYDSFYSTGSNKWFNDEEEIHEWIEASIDSIEYCAQILGLKISANLT